MAYSSSLMVKDSTISGNSAYGGGGIYAYSSTVEITRSTLDDPLGGGILNDQSSIHLKKTVVDGVLYVDGYYP